MSQFIIYICYIIILVARLRHLQDGLFTGKIDAVDTLNNAYRVMFDRPDLGPHTIPDYEVQVW